MKRKIKQSTLLAIIFSSVLLLAARTVIDLTRDTTGLLPGSSGGTGVSSTATFPSSGTIATTAAVPNSGSCTNQVVTALNNGSTPTCTSVANAMLATGSYVQGTYSGSCTGTAVSGATTNFDFQGFGSTASICSTALTTAAGGMPMPTAGTVKNLFVKLGTAGKAGDKVTINKNGSATGAPTCTYATATTCNDTSSALTVAAGDIITVSNTTSASETAANISFSFQLWN